MCFSAGHHAWLFGWYNEDITLNLCFMFHVAWVLLPKMCVYMHVCVSVCLSVCMSVRLCVLLMNGRNLMTVTTLSIQLLLSYSVKPNSVAIWYQPITDSITLHTQGQTTLFCADLVQWMEESQFVHHLVLTSVKAEQRLDDQMEGCVSGVCGIIG